MRNPFRRPKDDVIDIRILELSSSLSFPEKSEPHDEAALTERRRICPFLSGGINPDERGGGEKVQAIIANGTPEEIAALVRATQERQIQEIKVKIPPDGFIKDLSGAIRGTLSEKPIEG